MNCSKCRRRLRPLRKRAKTGQVQKEFIGVKWCPACKVAIVVDPQAAIAHRQRQRELEELLTAERSDPSHEPPEAA